MGQAAAAWRARFGTVCVRAGERASLLTLLTCIAVTLCPRTGYAEPVVRESRIESARGVAMGSGARASSASTQAQAENPANLPLGHIAHMESTFGYEPQLKAMAAGASVMDGMTSGYFAMGMATRFLFGDNSGWEGRLGLGVPIGEMIALGVAARYANFTSRDKHARPENLDAINAAEEAGDEPLAEDHTYKLKRFTMDASVTIRPMPAVAISALGYNLINTHTPLAPMLVGGSLSFGREVLSLGGDVLVDLNQHKQFNGVKLQIGGGLEYLTQGVAPLRAGYLYDQGRQQHAVTAGIGYLNKQFSIQISLRQYVTDQKDTMLFSAVQYYVQ
jgi:hypothetical protein